MTDEQPDAVDRASLIPYLQQTPAGVPDAIERIARIKALTGWLTSMEKPLRTWLENKGYEVESMTGSAFRTAAAGIGTAWLTNPQPKPRITDPETFADWCTDNTGLAVDEIQTIKIVDTAAAFDLIDRAVNKKGNREELRKIALDAFRVDTELLLPEGAMDKLVEDGTVKVTPAGVVDANGEKVPGTGVSEPGPRSLTVTPDKTLKDRVARELRELLGPPELAD